MKSTQFEIRSVRKRKRFHHSLDPCKLPRPTPRSSSIQYLPWHPSDSHHPAHYPPETRDKGSTGPNLAVTTCRLPPIRPGSKTSKIPSRILEQITLELLSPPDFLSLPGAPSFSLSLPLQRTAVSICREGSNPDPVVISAYSIYHIYLCCYPTSVRRVGWSGSVNQNGVSEKRKRPVYNLLTSTCQFVCCRSLCKRIRMLALFPFEYLNSSLVYDSFYAHVQASTLPLRQTLVPQAELTIPPILQFY